MADSAAGLERPSGETGDDTPIKSEPETDPAVLAQLMRGKVDLRHLVDDDWDALLSAVEGAARCARLKASMQRITQNLSEKPKSTRQLVVLKRLLAMRVALGKVSVAKVRVHVHCMPGFSVVSCQESQCDASHGMSSHPVLPRLPLSCGAPG